MIAFWVFMVFLYILVVDAYITAYTGETFIQRWKVTEFEVYGKDGELE